MKSREFGQLKYTPLAAVLRPKTLDEVIGQAHLVGPNAPLRLMTEKRAFVSSIIWGPPGGGKTTIVRAMAADSKCHFTPINATSASINDIRKILKVAELELATGKQTLCFIDECLSYNTMITCRLCDGTESVYPIGEIVDNKLDCEVLSMNLETGQYEWQKIDSWSKLPPRNMIEVEIEHNGITSIIRCSEDHLVYTTNRGYVAAKALTEGDEPIFLS